MQQSTIKYQEYSALPAFRHSTPDEKPVAGDSLLWSGKADVPALGSFIDIRMNQIGPAEVIGYFSDAGWLGVLAKPLSPPEWFIRQEGYNRTCHVFGAEIGAVLDKKPVIAGPNQAQLAALARYATATGRFWKHSLEQAWASGADEREPDGHLLRQVRDQFGPSWLNGRSNPIKQ